ncbi:MAG: hypothetical protein ABIW82_15805 [Dokdonella sp.]
MSEIHSRLGRSATKGASDEIGAGLQRALHRRLIGHHDCEDALNVFSPCTPNQADASEKTALYIFSCQFSRRRRAKSFRNLLRYDCV